MADDMQTMKAPAADRSNETDRVALEAITPWLDGRSASDVFDQFDDQGYVVFDNVLSPDELERIRAALDPHLVKLGRNDFEGFKTNRVYSLLAKAPAVFSDLVTHPLPLAFAERDLGRSCLLSALLAINLLPGETVQDWHIDDGNITIPHPRPSFGVSAFWAIDETTETNGATEIIPGSHRWTDEDRPRLSSPSELHDTRERDPDFDPHPRSDSIKALLPAGSLMLTKGTLFHRGGANKSDAPRLVVTPQYCPGWARQLENMVLAVPKETAATLPQRTRELMGYNIHGTFMGYVDGVHPDRSLGIGAREEV